MPQMMPMNWLISFLLFIMIFIMFNILNYYSYNINFKSKNINKFKSNKLSWKW